MAKAAAPGNRLMCPTLTVETRNEQRGHSTCLAWVLMRKPDPLRPAINYTGLCPAGAQHDGSAPEQGHQWTRLPPQHIQLQTPPNTKVVILPLPRSEQPSCHSGSAKLIRASCSGLTERSPQQIPHPLFNLDQGGSWLGGRTLQTSSAQLLTPWTLGRGTPPRLGYLILLEAGLNGHFRLCLQQADHGQAQNAEKRRLHV